MAYRASELSNCRGVGDTVIPRSWASFSDAREGRQSARREKLHRHTAINLRTSGYYFNSQVSGRVSSEKHRPLSQPAAQKEKWPSDLIYERTNERTNSATLDSSSDARARRFLLSYPLLSSRPPAIGEIRFCSPNLRRRRLRARTRDRFSGKVATNLLRLLRVSRCSRHCT